ncbi:MAG: ParB/RepB/Spo0J family partition protein [Bacteroidales bacterium]|nr:ParB/RepB/Spo0J family partition protein [Bacteroidales bacterium]
MADKNKKGGLGQRGLDVLLSSKNAQTQQNEIPIDSIEVNPFQPRRDFDEEKLKELADSIKELGVIQAISVKDLGGGKYQLISGERRLRASKIAGLKKIPAYIRTNVDDQSMLEMALVENIQRDDLNAIEVALTYQQLIDECHLTQEQLAVRVGKSRPSIANFLRLLNLPPKIQTGIRDEKISMGHARALLAAKDEETMLMIYDQILKYDFSVRKVDEIIKEYNGGKKESPKAKRKKAPVTSEDYVVLQKSLSSCFATDVELKRNSKGNGKIIIPFKNDTDLERLILILDKLNS